MNDTELKRKLAEMTSEIVFYRNPQFPSLATFRWRKSGDEIRETEWLHICWLIEQKLDNAQAQYYYHKVGMLIGDYMLADFNANRIITATWKQRAEALIKVLSK
jgi:hypothetical protein